MLRMADVVPPVGPSCSDSALASCNRALGCGGSESRNSGIRGDCDAEGARENSGILGERGGGDVKRTSGICGECDGEGAGGDSGILGERGGEDVEGTSGILGEFDGAVLCDTAGVVLFLRLVHLNTTLVYRNSPRVFL